ncbi:hypothetical protein F5144DRAFT_581242 [Chaetomium tenue]|uniref:Uncharacterized protein n=1 Tax=Chaetomium tenue TaxID=1854479 RepID=A0ACB7NYI5_9PEZI|nr:hypothetical protein F5144DRAFT_581242 [Chaetomium globosum]
MQSVAVFPPFFHSSFLFRLWIYQFHIPLYTWRDKVVGRMGGSMGGWLDGPVLLSAFYFVVFTPALALRCSVALCYIPPWLASGSWRAWYRLASFFSVLFVSACLFLFSLYTHAVSFS